MSAKGSTTSGFKRHYKITENKELKYDMYLAVDGRDLFHHLENKLARLWLP